MNFVSSRINRFSPLEPYKWSENTAEKIAIKNEPGSSLTRTSDGQLVVDPEAYPDDLLRDVLRACLSVRRLTDSQKIVITEAGTAVLIAMDQRAVICHGYSGSAKERAFKPPQDIDHDKLRINMNLGLETYEQNCTKQLEDIK
jgi:hypothetical protein